MQFHRPTAEFQENSTGCGMETTFYPDRATDTTPNRKREKDTMSSRKKLMAAVKKLPENHRRALILKRFYHKSYEAIAREVNVSPAEAKHLVIEALLTLKPEIN